MQDAHPIRIDRYPSGLGELVLSIALISEPEPPEASQRPWTTRRSSRSSTAHPGVSVPFVERLLPREVSATLLCIVTADVCEKWATQCHCIVAAITSA